MNPVFKVPKIQAAKPVGMPKPIKLPAPPKIASIHVTPLTGGIKVQHNMTHGPKPIPFVFSDPARMKQHLTRIQASEWRMPDRNEGSAVDKALDLNSGTGTSSW